MKTRTTAAVILTMVLLGVVGLCIAGCAGSSAPREETTRRAQKKLTPPPASGPIIRRDADGNLIKPEVPEPAEEVAAKPASRPDPVTIAPPQPAPRVQPEPAKPVVNTEPAPAPAVKPEPTPKPEIPKPDDNSRTNAVKPTEPAAAPPVTPPPSPAPSPAPSVPEPNAVPPAPAVELPSSPRAEARPPGAALPAKDQGPHDSVRLSQARELAISVIEEASRSRDPQVRANAMELSALAAPRLRTSIELGLGDPNVGVRTSAMVTAGKAKLSELADRVAPGLEDQSPYVRAAAIYAMHRFGRASDRAISPLAEILLDDPSTKIRSHAAWILGEMKNRSAVAMLREAARAKPARASDIDLALMRLQISEALVKLGEDKEIESIRASLYGSRPEDLEAVALAVQILGQLRDRGATTQLVYLAERKDKAGNPMPAEIRLAVAAAAARIETQAGDFVADEFAQSPNPAIRAQAAHVYGLTRPGRNLTRLEAMAKDGEPLVRVYAAGAILRTVEALTTGQAPE